MEYMRDDVYSGIGKFIVSYERTQATMKYVIVSNTIVPNFKVGKGRDLGAYKVLKHFRNFMTSNYLSNEITNVNFNIGNYLLWGSNTQRNLTLGTSLSG